MTTLTLSVMLAYAPPDSQPDHRAEDFSDQLHHAEVTRSGDETRLVAYDEDGVAIGTIALWSDSTGHYLASDYADGWAEIVVLGDSSTTYGSLPAATVAERAALVATVAEGKVECAASVGLAAVGCTVTSGIVVITCPATMILAICTFADVLDIEVRACED